MDVKLCRLCANKKDSFIGVYDADGHKLSIETKINKCLQIELYPEDHLPKTVCLDCCGKLEQSYRFLETSHIAQMTLLRLFPVGQPAELKEEESLVELLPLTSSLDQTLANHHQLPGMNHSLVGTLVEEKHEDGIVNIIIEDEEEEEQEDEEEEDSQDNMDAVNEDVGELDNDENEPGSGLSNQRQSNAEHKKKLEELTDLEIEEIMQKDEQWQRYPWLCADCSQELPTIQQLKEHHETLHKQNPQYMCAQCSKVFPELNLFFCHIKRHRNLLLKYSCEECGKSFSNKRVLNSHSASHHNIRPYVCHECGKTFRHQNALLIHTRCHLPDNVKNKYMCELCNKRFSTKPNLITHKRIHTGVRNYTCEQCGKSFIQKGNLDAHMLTHSQDKPFTCEMCNKGFKTAMQLRKHHTVHTGAKPHQCEICGRSFRERGTLRDHLRIHTGAMPFTCEFCGKTFRFKGILTTHKRQHTGERPYSCVECQHHFTNWPNYNKHMKRRHGINTSRQSRSKPPPPPPEPPQLEPLPIYEDYPATYHSHPNSFSAPAPTSLQQFFTFTQLPSQSHLDPTMELLQHR